MAELLLFHHAQGQTDGFAAFAESCGEPVTRFTRPICSTVARSTASTRAWPYAAEIGFPDQIIERGEQAAKELPEALVYAGFSLGVVPAQKLAQTRAGARGALFFYSCLPPSYFGSWPAGVPVQIHAMGRRPDLRRRGRHRRRPRGRSLVRPWRTLPLPRRRALFCRLQPSFVRR